MKNYSNYHSVNLNEKLSHDGLLLLENSLNGFEGYDVRINNSINSAMLVYQKYDSESTIKKVIGRIEDIEIGNVLTIDETNWLIITYPEDNKIYRKAEIQLCNSNYPIKTNKTRVLKGHDGLGKPIYQESYAINKVTPCIVETKTSSADTNAQLSFPNNSILITVKYQTSDTLKENFEFNMYNDKYKVINVDYTKVINEKGIVKILAERV
jgi:hypothetical protein